MAYYFFRLALCMKANWDIAVVCTVAAGLNFLQSRKRPYWHAYQVSFNLIEWLLFVFIHGSIWSVLLALAHLELILSVACR